MAILTPQRKNVDVGTTSSGMALQFTVEYKRWSERKKQEREDQRFSKKKDPMVSKLMSDKAFKEAFDGFNATYGKSLELVEPLDTPFIGREVELKSLSATCANNSEPTRLVIGEAGQGKTTLVREFVRRVRDDEIENPMGQKIVMFELGIMQVLPLGEAMFIGTMNKVISLIKELEEVARKSLNDPDIRFLLFIDEVHMLVKAIQKENGESIGSDVFKTQLKTGFDGLIVIGATTRKEYNNYIRTNDPFLERFSATTFLPYFSYDDNLRILSARWKQLRDERCLKNTKISNEILRKIMSVNATYYPDRAEPRKSLQVLGMLDAWSVVNNREVDIELLKTVFRADRGIEVDKKIDSKKMIETINRRLKGQILAKDSLETLAKSILGEVNRDTNRPLFNTIFVGPTGVGKTEAALAINESLFGENVSIIKVNTPTFANMPNGTGAGAMFKYVGERLVGNGEVVILIDEAEKGFHTAKNDKIGTDLQTAFLEMMDKGEFLYYDKYGNEQRAILKNSCIIFTSNAGYEAFENEEQFGSMNFSNNISKTQLDTQRSGLKSMLDKRLKKDGFSPEFLGRQNAIVLFNSLGEYTGIEIARYKVDEYVQNIKDRYGLEIVFDGYTLYTEEDDIDNAPSKEFEARPIEVYLSKTKGHMRDSREGGARNIIDILNSEVKALIGDLFFEYGTDKIRKIYVTIDVIRNPEIEVNKPIHEADRAKAKRGLRATTVEEQEMRLKYEILESA